MFPVEATRSHWRWELQGHDPCLNVSAVSMKPWRSRALWTNCYLSSIILTTCCITYWMSSGKTSWQMIHLRHRDTSTGSLSYIMRYDFQANHICHDIYQALLQSLSRLSVITFKKSLYCISTFTQIFILCKKKIHLGVGEV